MPGFNRKRETECGWCSLRCGNGKDGDDPSCKIVKAKLSGSGKTVQAACHETNEFGEHCAEDWKASVEA